MVKMLSIMQLTCTVSQGFWCETNSCVTIVVCFTFPIEQIQVKVALLDPS